MLALKLLLVPSFLALVSLAGRRWGPNVAGWLAGFPAVAGSILLVLALERGAEFAATAATATLAAVFASASFSFAYSHLCLRYPWTIASPLAITVWALASIAVSFLPASLPLALALAMALTTLLAAPMIFPSVDDLPLLPNLFDRRELFLRMAVGAALTLLVSLLALTIGPARSGILSAFPVIGSVLAVFCQRSSGSAFVVILLRTMVRGLYAFTAFCFVLAILLPHYGIAAGFLGATIVATIVQAAFRQRDRIDAARRLKPDTVLR